MATQFVCFKPTRDQTSRLFRAKAGYRVNPYTVGQLMREDKRSLNEKQIMFDIQKYGPVTCTVKVFDPLNLNELHKNFYLYQNGVYGHPWDKDPRMYDGYHALCIIGWGSEYVKTKGKNEEVKYWILRNSWGEEWGIQGYGKIVRGVNRAIVESDIWAPKY